MPEVHVRYEADRIGETLIDIIAKSILPPLVAAALNVEGVEGACARLFYGVRRLI